MSKTIQIIGRTPGMSWNLVEARITGSAAVDKTCGHNQDSIEICWTWIQKETDEEKNSRRASNEKRLYSQCLLACMLARECISFRALKLQEQSLRSIEFNQNYLIKENQKFKLIKKYKLTN